LAAKWLALWTPAQTDWITMSRAFVKEVEPETIDLPDRTVSSHPNLVTAEGLAAIERTLSRLEAANNAAIAKNDRTTIAAIQRELRYWIDQPE
jgi:hypothetical protein